MPVMGIPGVAVLAAAKNAAAAEKARQSTASLHVANIYQFIMAGVLGTLFIRNVVLLLLRFVARRRRRSADAVEKASSTKGAGASSIYGPKPILIRISGVIDSIALQPIDVWGIPGDWTWLRLLMVTFICAANIVCCLVGTRRVFLVIDTKLHSPQQAGSSIARAFARRCGRMCVANVPMIYGFAGRNNIVATLTGELMPFFSQELRFYHILLGGIAFIEAFIHTFAYIGHALVFMAVNCFFGLKWVRRRCYELFLITHVVGAALVLAGLWYHRPIAQDWVYAAVAVWCFERACRLGLHVSSIFRARVIMRRPLLEARASIVHGAIKLSVPFPAGKWQAGQHVYLSFWGLDLLRKPWLYGQSHPFSISNIPDAAAHDEQELRFVLRVHNGLTRTLASHIQQKCVAKGAESVAVSVAVEGPYGWAPAAEEFDSVLLIAGGSGITHPASILADVCQHASHGQCGTSNVQLVWAIHHLDQSEWVRETIEEARSHADKANLSLSINLHVTRPSTHSASSSGTVTPAESPRLEFDEKKHEFGETVSSFAKARRFTGRPDVAEAIAKTVADSPGTTLVVACGPVALADEVRRIGSKYASSALQVQIARFEC
ncbi:SPOSA6832_04257, partial [Sporobolomyces salmonicolor]